MPLKRQCSGTIVLGAGEGAVSGGGSTFPSGISRASSIVSPGHSKELSALQRTAGEAGAEEESERLAGGSVALAVDMQASRVASAVAGNNRPESSIDSIA